VFFWPDSRLHSFDGFFSDQQRRVPIPPQSVYLLISLLRSLPFFSSAISAPDGSLPWYSRRSAPRFSVFMAGHHRDAFSAQCLRCETTAVTAASFKHGALFRASGAAQSPWGGSVLSIGKVKKLSRNRNECTTLLLPSCIRHRGSFHVAAIQSGTIRLTACYSAANRAAFAKLLQGVPGGRNASTFCWAAR